ncbi:MAG: hypothetical protein J7L99_07865 [Planctomycetes bacterium]|nr:hypothetical protein [Planctomycetota bacterium]
MAELTMEHINAIAKVRFNSARPQRVHLGKSDDFTCDLLCFEPGQEYSATERCAYYFIAANGVLKAGKEKKNVAMGHLVIFEKDQPHTIINTSEQRLICLAISPK